MRTMLVDSVITNTQEVLHTRLNNLSHNHKFLGRCCSIPVAAADVILEMLKSLAVIEAAAMAAINLIGKAFSSDFNFKDALGNAEWTLIHIANAPIKLVAAPVKFIYQFFAILYDPEKVSHFNYFKESFRT
ncbi:MAG: hypothetical protein H0V82_09590 [Candidatus Protochlamydia sp.]|nr:hypothetical protein [Candidatus Protochlamydia sp.]